MKQRDNKTRPSLKRVVVFLVLVAALPMLVFESAFAQGSASSTMPIDRAKAYTAFHFLKACLDLSHGSENGVRVMDVHGVRRESQLASGDVFARNAGTAGTNLRAGWLITEGSMPNGDGWAECRGSDPGRFLNAVGIDPLEFFTDATGIFEVGDPDYERAITDRSDQITAMKNAFKEEFPSVNFDAAMSRPMAYWPLLQSARKKCDISEDDKVQNGGTQVKIVNVETGEITTTRYRINDSDNEHTTGTYISNGGDSTATCEDIISRLNDAAQVTSDTIKNLLAEGVPPSESIDEGSLGDDAEAASTPDCEGGGLSFVICPLVEGLASLADGIVETFLQPILRAELLDLPGSGDESSEALYSVWKGFRNIANALLVLAFLAIIISTAMSSE